MLGGLGNNMFQYAAGYTYAKKHNKKLIIFNQDTNFPNVYKIKNPIVSHPEQKHLFIEQIDIFFRDVIHIDAFDYIIGNFQDPYIFEEYRNQLSKIFTIRTTVNRQENKTYIKQIKKSNSISIHIRRTDYLTVFPKSTLSEQYYKNAISYIKSRVKNPHFFIFSDDINWVKENLALGDTPHTFVTCNQSAESSAWDMHLMQLCKHNIIANSSFSWWGAYLNKNPNKIVICPNEWIIDSDLHREVTKYIIPSNWIKIPACF